jgi:hypothetical protein
MVRPKNQN